MTWSIPAHSHGGILDVDKVCGLAVNFVVEVLVLSFLSAAMRWTGVLGEKEREVRRSVCCEKD